MPSLITVHVTACATTHDWRKKKGAKKGNLSLPKSSVPPSIMKNVPFGSFFMVLCMQCLCLDCEPGWLLQSWALCLAVSAISNPMASVKGVPLTNKLQNCEMPWILPDGFIKIHTVSWSEVQEPVCHLFWMSSFIMTQQPEFHSRKQHSKVKLTKGNLICWRQLPNPLILYMLMSCKARSNQENLKHLDAIRFIFTVSAEKRPSADDDEAIHFNPRGHRLDGTLRSFCLSSWASSRWAWKHENMKYALHICLQQKKQWPQRTSIISKRLRSLSWVRVNLHVRLCSCGSMSQPRCPCHIGCMRQDGRLTSSVNVSVSKNPRHME